MSLGFSFFFYCQMHVVILFHIDCHASRLLCANPSRYSRLLILWIELSRRRKTVDSSPYIMILGPNTTLIATVISVAKALFKFLSQILEHHCSKGDISSWLPLRSFLVYSNDKLATRKPVLLKLGYNRNFGCYPKLFDLKVI